MISWRGFWVGLTQLLNGSTGGNPDQTFSGRCALAAMRGSKRGIFWEALVDLIFAAWRAERDHCRKNIEWDRV